ncbi:Intradiol ring-cleavage dioxygenase [Leptodontidium sp. 2 PMI_412]|nr:Intradiol ring-cleavage dioxygenase [Leptodontidium sp. 2 PMI_412]
MKFVFESLVTYLHDFAHVGKISTETRHEFILLSDILGLSLLLDSIDHPTPPGATEATILGPFHTQDAHHVGAGEKISHDSDGERLLVVCSVKDTRGRPLPGVEVDVWETDSKGFYDVQYSDRTVPDGRAIVTSDENGVVVFEAIVPVPYPIPSDGPVGKLLGRLKRHPYRPSHMHFMFNKAGFGRLTTALYLRGDPYESSDAVFGVKESLIIDLCQVQDIDGLAERCGVSPETRLLKLDFVLLTAEEQRNTLEAEVQKEAARHNGTLKVVNGLLVPAEIRTGQANE